MKDRSKFEKDLARFFKKEYVNDDHVKLHEAYSCACGSGAAAALKEFQSVIDSGDIDFRDNHGIYYTRLTTKGRRRFIALEKKKGRKSTGFIDRD